MADVRLAILALLCASVASAAELPYSAKVTVPRAEVFSGPGRQHYATDRLNAGQTVEVHRVEPGGWCAIRPPAGSFSWVEARFLAAAPNQGDAVLRVAGDDVPSYIGSRLGPERSASRVRLRRDELVETLDEETLAGKRWYKISPPAGEFRWIEAAQIAEGSGVRAQGSERTPERDANALKPPKSPTTDPRPLTPTIRPEPVDDPRELRAHVSKYTPAAHAIAASPVTDAPPQSAPATIGDELRQLELRLSLALAEDASRWELDEPRRVAERLLDRAVTTADRDAVRTMLAKLSRLDAIQQRRQGTKSPRAERPALLPPLSADRDPPPARLTTDDESRYDGVGRLREVVTRNVAAAPFALVDEADRVKTYVSPAPGVNLRAHVGQRVGIYGVEGVVADRGQRHLTAQRIMPLNERR